MRPVFYNGFLVMNLYEIVLIGRQSLTQQQIEALVVGLTFFVTQNNGEVVRGEYCGHRDLEYPIKKNTKGHYYVLQIKLDSKFIKEMERIMSLNEDIIRFLVVKTDFFETRENLITQSKFRNSNRQVKDTGYRNSNKAKDVVVEENVEIVAEVEE